MLKLTIKNKLSLSLCEGILAIMLLIAISIHFCLPMVGSESSSRAELSQAASGEEGERSVKSDLDFAIPQGNLHGINITPKSQLSRSLSGVGHSISQRQPQIQSSVN